MAKIVKEKQLKYGDRDHFISIKTKSGKEIGGHFFDWLLPRWSVVPIVLTLIVLTFNVAHMVVKNNRYAIENKNLVAQIKRDKKTLASEKKKAKPVVIYKNVVVSTHNATDIGESVANSMMVISKKQDAKTKDSVSDSDLDTAVNILHKTLDKTPDDWSKIKSWLKQPDWTLEFLTKASFDDDVANVVFQIKDNSGKVVGFVTAKYDAVDDMLHNCKVTYSSDVAKLKLDRGTTHE